MYHLTLPDADRSTAWAFIASILDNHGITGQALSDCKLCVGEALQNICRYAQVPTARITVTPTQGAVVVLIADEGDGFDADGLPEPELGQIGGYGVSIIRRLYGRAAVSSSPGRGTEVRLVVSQ
jgi:signal transduction histidine kinase